MLDFPSQKQNAPQEIVVLSGKGGAGKTSITAAFAHLAAAQHNTIICDLDVDTPDLHILLTPNSRENHPFISGHEASINANSCTGCNQCAQVCRFDAITERESGPYVNPIRCEGCKVCVTLCPEQAIDFEEKQCGSWRISDTRFGDMVHAQLFPGEENSGRLVTLLKNEARALAQNLGSEMILCDGAPGIGCPVISSLSGADLAVLVTEPTLSGRHDLQRVAELCLHFNIPTVVIINKFDLNPKECEAIEQFCQQHGCEVIARLPHDLGVTRAMAQRLAVTEATPTSINKPLRSAWAAIQQYAGVTPANQIPV